MSDVITALEGPQTFLLQCGPPIQNILYGGGRGGGKGLLATATIITPFGPRRLGDIKVGNLISNPDGGASEVLAVYHRGKQKIYDVKFADGTVIKADGDHLWLVWIANKERKGEHFYLHSDESCKKMKVLSTDELRSRLDKTKTIKSNYNVLVPCTDPVKFTVTSKWPTDIDPYVLGLILGDGHITPSGHVHVSSSDEETEQFLQARNWRIYKSPGKVNTLTPTGSEAASIKRDIKRLGLSGKLSDEKFIPRRFLRGSIDCRIALLQGLMDTDGYASKDGKLNYDTVSEQLAKDVQHIVESLGGWATITSKIGSYKNSDGEKVLCKRVYRLFIQLPDKSIAFRLSRKKARVEQLKTNGTRRLYRKIVSIDPAGEEETICIRVDHPNRLFLTDHFIVTHNTFGVVLKIQQHHDLYGDAMRGLVIRRTVPQLADFIKKSKEVFLQLGWTWKKGERTFVNNRTGAEVLLRHMDGDDDADNFLGHEYTILVVEELGDFSSEIDEVTGKHVLGADIKKIRATLRSAKGVPTMFIATANPGGKCHMAIKNTWIDPMPGGMVPFPDPKTGRMKIFIPSLLEDNYILDNNDPTYRESLKDCGPPWLVEAWLHGNWDVSPEGNAFKREYIRYCQPLPLDRYWHIIHSWDTAYKDHKNADRSACTVWGVAPDGYHLLHAWAGRVQFPKLVEMVTTIGWQYPPDAVFVEDKASGTSLIQQLRQDTRLPIIEVPVDANKLARAYAVTNIFAAGKVFLPQQQTSWMYDYIDELTSFPLRDQDDYVDSTSQGLSRLKHYSNLMLNNQSNVVPFTGSIYNM